MFVAYDDKNFYVPCFSGGTHHYMTVSDSGFAIVCHENREPSAFEKTYVNSIPMNDFGEIGTLERIKLIDSYPIDKNIKEEIVDDLSFMVFGFFDGVICYASKYTYGKIDWFQNIDMLSTHHGESEFNFIDMTARGYSEGDIVKKMAFAIDTDGFDVLKVDRETLSIIVGNLDKASGKVVFYA